MEQKSNLPAIQNCPPLPEYQVEVWDRLCTRMSDCKSRAGIYLLLCGWSYREASSALNLTYRTLSDASARYGLRGAINGTNRAIENHREVEIHATEALIDKGRDDKLKDESARDLAVVAGISRTKITEWEKQHERPQDALTFLERIAQGMAGTGMRLDLSLSPAETGGVVVDVETVPTPHALP